MPFCLLGIIVDYLPGSSTVIISVVDLPLSVEEISLIVSTGLPMPGDLVGRLVVSVVSSVNVPVLIWFGR